MCHGLIKGWGAICMQLVRAALLHGQLHILLLAHLVGGGKRPTQLVSLSKGPMGVMAAPVGSLLGLICLVVNVVASKRVL